MSLLTDNLTATKTAPEIIPRVIFLDIEGVVVTHRSLIVEITNAQMFEDGVMRNYTGATNAKWHRFIDKHALGLVFFLAKEMECQIVVTSTLRFQQFVHLGLLEAAPLFAKGRYGNEADKYMSFCVTDKLGKREDEIRKFVADHNVQEYVVLDDRGLQIENFVQVSPYEGFSVSDCATAKFMLSKEGKYDGEMPAIFL